MGQKNWKSQQMEFSFSYHKLEYVVRHLEFFLQYPFSHIELGTLLSSVQFSHSVMSDVLQSHGLYHTSLPCPTPTPGACSNSCLSSQWCHATISFCHPLLLCSIFPSIRVFSNESAFCISRPKYWSFSISSSNEYSGLISFRIDWFDLLAVQGLSRVFSNTTVCSMK